MVSVVAATGDLFLATERTRVNLGHLRKKLRFRPYVSPEPTVEDLDGHPVILHPGHVRTFLVVRREPLERCLADLVWKTVHLLVNCPATESRPGNLPTGPRAVARKQHGRLLIDSKVPFTFGPGDFLAIVRIKPASGRGETIGVLGGYVSHLASRAASRLQSSALSVPYAGERLAPGGFCCDSTDAAVEHHQGRWLRC
jgi:hypothetical protein